MLTAIKAVPSASALAIGAFLSFALCGPAASIAPVPSQLAGLGKLEYDVLRDGDKIGEHRFAFKREGEALHVVIETDVRVKLAFVTLYRFLHHGTERWVGDRLVELSSTTDDDGTNHEMQVAARDGKLAVTADKKASVRPAETVPASLWHPAILKAPETLNTIDGSMMAIKAALVAEEPVKGPGGPVPAKHYAITGDLQRELWFDSHGTLLKVRFKGQDGSDIQYVLK